MLVMLLPAVQPLESKETSTGGEMLRSSLAGLNTERVYLSVDTDHKYHDTIRDRVLRAFNKQGLRFSENEVYQQGQILLKLTVRPDPIRSDPIKGGGAGNVLYYKNLELFENVISERSPKIKTWAVTWSFGIPNPILSGMISIDQLERDADELIGGFIQDFLFTNGKGKTDPGESGKRRECDTC